MKHYNIAFVGMGSIGKRHLFNTCEYIRSRGDTYTIDLYRSSIERELPIEILSLVSKQYLSKAPIQNQYDVVFITNPTSLHLETAVKFRPYTKAFFIEKPIFDRFDIEDSIIATLDEIPSYVACPLHYNPVLKFVKENIDFTNVISVRAMSSSYLPDWRPGQDYRQTYSAHTNLGGGVDIDLIHEWDYLTWIFGMPTECFGIFGKYSSLEIDSNDTALYVAKNKQMTFEVHLDYYGRIPQRTLDIFLNDETIHCDISGGVVSYLKSGKVLKFDNDRNSYHLNQIRHFFDIVEERCENDSNIKHALDVLKLTKSKI